MVEAPVSCLESDKQLSGPLVDRSYTNRKATEVGEVLIFVSVWADLSFKEQI